MTPRAGSRTTTLEVGFARARESVGRFNLGIFGPTGVGKSTLLNALFGDEVAATGVGHPVTQKSHLYVRADKLLGIFDTKGLEIGEEHSAVISELRRFVESNRLGDISDQLHIAWYCFRAGSRRIQPGEEAFIRELGRLGIPTVIVITQTPVSPSGEIHEDALKLGHCIEDMRLPVRGGIHFVNAKPDTFAGVPAYGLESLLEATFDVVPEGVRSALAAAQRMSRELKHGQALRAIDDCVEDVRARAFLPDLQPKWAGLYAEIAEIYGLPEDQARAVLETGWIVPFLEAALTFANLGGIVTPFSPGPVISWSRRLAQRARRADGSGASQAPHMRTEMGTGLAAGKVTRALGEAWLATCDHFWLKLYPESVETSDPQLVANYFMNELEGRLPRALRYQRTRTGGQPQKPSVRTPKPKARRKVKLKRRRESS